LVGEESDASDDLESLNYDDWECDLTGELDEDGGCSTIEGDLSLSLFGLLGLVGWLRRR
jgi:hypothetical protein